MASKKRKEPPVTFVKCPECGEEQADMGRNMQCDFCGYGPMPSTADGKEGSTDGK